MNNTGAFAWRFIVPMVAGVLIALIGVIATPALPGAKLTSV